MHCVESMEEIGTHYNLTLFTHQQILYVLYANPSNKLAGRVSSVAMIVLWQVTETVVEAIFYAPVCGLSALVVILIFYMSRMIVSTLLYVVILPSVPHLSGQ